MFSLRRRLSGPALAASSRERCESAVRLRSALGLIGRNRLAGLRLDLKHKGIEGRASVGYIVLAQVGLRCLTLSASLCRVLRR